MHIYIYYIYIYIPKHTLFCLYNVTYTYDFRADNLTLENQHAITMNEKGGHKLKGEWKGICGRVWGWRVIKKCSTYNIKN